MKDGNKTKLYLNGETSVYACMVEGKGDFSGIAQEGIRKLQGYFTKLSFPYVVNRIIDSPIRTVLAHIGAHYSFAGKSVRTCSIDSSSQPILDA